MAENKESGSRPSVCRRTIGGRQFDGSPSPRFRGRADRPLPDSLGGSGPSGANSLDSQRGRPGLHGTTSGYGTGVAAGIEHPGGGGFSELYADVARQITVEKGQTNNLKIDLDAQFGSLTIKTTPEQGAEIFFAK